MQVLLDIFHYDNQQWNFYLPLLIHALNRLTLLLNYINWLQSKILMTKDTWIIVLSIYQKYEKRKSSSRWFERYYFLEYKIKNNIKHYLQEALLINYRWGDKIMLKLKLLWIFSTSGKMISLFIWTKHRQKDNMEYSISIKINLNPILCILEIIKKHSVVWSIVIKV